MASSGFTSGEPWKQVQKGNLSFAAFLNGNLLHRSYKVFSQTVNSLIITPSIPAIIYYYWNISLLKF